MSTNRPLAIDRYGNVEVTVPVPFQEQGGSFDGDRPCGRALGSGHILFLDLGSGYKDVLLIIIY